MARTRQAREATEAKVERSRARAQTADAASKRPAPRPPNGLKVAGRECWRLTWSSCPWLNQSHAGVVRRLCDLNDQRVELQTIVAKTGWTTTGSQGQVVENPLLATQRACEVSISRCEKQLGIAVSMVRAAAMTDDATAASGSARDVVRLSDLVKKEKQ